MTEETIQFIAILVTVTALLGWLLKQVITHFIKSSNKNATYIEKLVEQNQENTKSFVNTINHQRTMDREMQSKHLETMKEIKQEMKNTNEVNTKLFNYLNK